MREVIQVNISEMEALRTADPCLKAATMEYGDFVKLYRDLKVTELKRIVSARKLATGQQLEAAHALTLQKKSTGSKRDVYINLIWEGAQRDLETKRIPLEQ